jgi:hypothetical protein
MVDESDSKKPTRNVTEQTEEYLDSLPWEIGEIYEIRPGMYSETTNRMVKLDYKYVVLHDIYVTTSKPVHTDGKHQMIVMDVRFSNGHDTFVFIDWMRALTVGDNCPQSQYSCPECSGDIDVLNDNYPIIECSDCGWRMDDGRVVS